MTPLWLGAVLTVLLLLIIGGNIVAAYVGANEFAETEVKILEISGEIARLQDMLSCGAQLAVSTGNRSWLKSYARDREKLSAAMIEALRLGTPAFAQALSDVRAAEEQLRGLEDRAIALASAGRRQEAAELLASAAFAQASQEYVAGLRLAQKVLLHEGDQKLAYIRQTNQVGAILASAAMVALLALWAYAIPFVRRHFNFMESARRALELAGQELERKVRARTAQLEQSNDMLLNEIEHRNEAERALRESRQNYLSIFNSVNDAIFVHDSESGVILEVNQRCEALFGYAKAQLLALSVADISAGDAHSNQQAAWEKIQSAIEGGAQVFEWLAKHQSGRLFWVEISLQKTVYQGKTQLLAVVRDIDQQKRDQQMLQTQRHLLELFVEHAPASIVMLDSDLRFVMGSKAWVESFGLRGQDLAGRQLYEILPNLPERWKAVYKRCLDGAVEHMEEDILDRPDGQIDWCRWECRPWYSAEEKIAGLMLYLELITDKKKAQDQLDLAFKFFDNAIEGVMVTNADGVIETVNRGFTIITGYHSDEAIGKTPRLLRSDHHGPEFYKAMWESIRQHGEWSGEIWNRRKNGEAFLEWQTIMAQRDAEGNVLRYVSIFHDITDVRLSEEKIEYQANYDALTDLPNRTLFSDRLNLAIDQARAAKQMIAVISLDLDNFKNVNDTLGLPLGDQMIKLVGHRLAAMDGPGISVGRQGGDEYLIMAEGLTHPRQGVKVVHDISALFAEPFHLAGAELFLTSSMGLSFYPNDGSDAATLLKNADTALHQAKLRGKNTYHLFEPRLNSMVSDRLNLENRLRKALERQEFLIYYQPKVDLRDGRMKGMEALIRWQSPDEGLVPPDMFIPLAEETGLIVPIGQWVLDAACQQAKSWRDKYDPELRVAVNLSPRQFQEVDMMSLVSYALSNSGLTPDGLELEITESLVLPNLNEASSILKRLADWGLTITMDDFGTGYSSLSHLKNLPLDYLKIDKSFIMDIKSEGEDATLPGTIISMAHSMGIGVIAEGVETQAQLAILRRLNCDYIQGYFYSRPLPERQFEELLANPRQL